jgi:TM2 domain-containing membrane protein YozV
VFLLLLFGVTVGIIFFFLDHIWYRYLKKKQNNQKIYYDDKNYKKDKKRVRNNHIF